MRPEPRAEGCDGRAREQSSGGAMQNDGQDQEYKWEWNPGWSDRAIPFCGLAKEPPTECRVKIVGDLAGALGPGLHGAPPVITARMAATSSGCQPSFPASASL